MQLKGKSTHAKEQGQHVPASYVWPPHHSITACHGGRIPSLYCTQHTTPRSISTSISTPGPCKRYCHVLLSCASLFKMPNWYGPSLLTTLSSSRLRIGSESDGPKGVHHTWYIKEVALYASTRSRIGGPRSILSVRASSVCNRGAR